MAHILSIGSKGAEAGPLEGKWNGKDDEGKAVSRGEYTWKVIVNRSKYENIGTIGNTGQPPTTSGHVPVYLAGSPLIRLTGFIRCRIGMSRIFRSSNGQQMMDVRNSTRTTL